jgi:hypothetical protein
MVVALAADKEVWGAVLANEVIQDYKRDLGKLLFFLETLEDSHSCCCSQGAC